MLRYIDGRMLDLMKSLTYDIFGNILSKCAYARKGRIKLPREIKSRRVCSIPERLRFIPEGCAEDVTVLTIEEVESIRLCDLESMDQDRAAELMNVSRGTLQRILYSAHKKIAEALCLGMEIRIEGGHYELSEARCKGKRKCSHCRFRHGYIKSRQGDAEDVGT